MAEFLRRDSDIARRWWLSMDTETVKVGDRYQAWQISLVDQDTGEEVMNEFLTHDCKGDCSCARAGRRMTGRIGPQELIEKLEAKGITGESTRFIAWATGDHDCAVMRDFFGGANFPSCFEKDRLLLPYHEFRRNLPKSFPLRLGEVFEMLFPDDPLYYQWHDALADAQMQRKIIQAFEPAQKAGQAGREGRARLRVLIQGRESTIGRHLV